ncbi:hypothetical protein HU200_059176 [Digitaria exilis]|uniref:Uncharacterized protein n=1 Tax=Digitaria exilis TaxID=1010633 RepID=A0A835ACG8_9POAL|nr:hypothetical protein HU200_059176 [Digitaria exilis]CAB3468723.1 unnamed protein product [Digitaria exilis]
MEEGGTTAGSSQLTARGKAPGQPPPPPPSGDEANGGHRRGRQRQRRILPRGRAVVVALVAMIPAAMFLLLDGTPAMPLPSAEWLLLAYFLWIIGLNLLVWLWLLN